MLRTSSILRRYLVTFSAENFLSTKEGQKRLEDLQIPKNAPSAGYLKQKIGQILRRRILNATIAKMDGLESSAELQKFESSAAYQYFRTHKEEYMKTYPEIVKNFRNQEKLKGEKRRNAWQKRQNASTQVAKTSFPLGKEEKVTVDPKAEVVPEKRPAKWRDFDRGFYVYSDQFGDDYHRGDTIDLPDDLLPTEQQMKLAEKTSESTDRKENFRRRFGAKDAVEDIEFQLPHQKIHPASTEAEGSGSGSQFWRMRYGVADPDIPASDKMCRGFLPADLFVELEKSKKFLDILCRRCYLLKHHDFLLNVNVSPVNYSEIMGKLKTLNEVLIILIVDMVDFTNSIFRQLPYLLGDGKPLMILGNKVDLLPPDAQADYLRHFRKCLIQSVRDVGFGYRFNLLYLGLISAKTGFGIERLITQIQTKWGVRGDIYLVGCTNVGKSSLFNALLQSDLCKIRAVDLVERATTSIWPGTTLNLLKFPVMNPTPLKLAMRERRLKMEQKRNQEEADHMWTLYQATQDHRFAVLQGYVGRTFEDRREKRKEMNRMAEDQVGSMYFIPETEKRKKRWDPGALTFKHGVWCLDSPGTVNDDQIINFLTLEELIDTVPRSCLMPRTYVIHPNESLLVGGLARVDYNSGPKLAYLTVFASRSLPVHVIRSENAENFLKKYEGTVVLKVPAGDPERLAKFPGLEKRELKIVGIGYKESCGDVTISSAGWIAVTGYVNSEMNFDVWTPQAKGIFLRQPALLPFAVNLRGNRIVGTSGYTVRPMGETD